MTMQKISIAKVIEIAEQYGLHPCRVKGTKGVNIRIRDNPRMEDMSWEEFEETLKRRGLAVYKAEKSDFLKIMKDR